MQLTNASMKKARFISDKSNAIDANKQNITAWK